MSKKKVSSADFMGLLDDQEVVNERPAFSPIKDPPPKARRPRRAAPTQMKIGKYTLGPAQTEVLRFVITRGQAIANDLSSKGQALANDLTSKGQALATDLTAKAQANGMLARAEKTIEVLRETIQRLRRAR